MRKLTKFEKSVLLQIPFGRENAKTASEIAKALKSDIRSVMDAIHTLIVIHKVPIGGAREGRRGFYIVRNEQEAIDASRPLQAQIRNETKRIEVLLDPDCWIEFV